MQHNRAQGQVGLVVAITLVLLVGSLGLTGGLGRNSTTPTSPALGAGGPTVSSGSTPNLLSSGAAPATPPSTVSPSAALGDAALRLAAQNGVPQSDVFVPNAEGALLPSTATGGHIEPVVDGGAAPIGIADYGLTNTTGIVVPSIVSTTSVAATFSTNSTVGPQPLYLDSTGPQNYGIQLNAVLTNVTLFGNTSTYGVVNQFWTQNVVQYSAATDQLYFIDNVWAISPGWSPNTLLAHGPNGTFEYPEFYYGIGPIVSIPYPFSLGLYLNATVIDGDTAVFFNYTLSNSSAHLSGSYDYVIFNSTGEARAGVAEYQANGFQYNPENLPNDFEVILGGPGGGSTTDFNTVNATLTLAYLNSSVDAYQAVPSAYDWGSDTGETSTGATVWYQGTTAHLTTGPSLLAGLWNATGTSSGSPGAEPLHLDLRPSNAFVFIEPEADWLGTNASPGPQFQWAPTTGVLPVDGALATSILLTPGPYAIGVFLADHDVDLTFENLSTGPAYLNVTLGENATMGLYTPLYFWSNDQLAGLSTSGTGAPGDPYLLVNDTGGTTVGAFFGGLNDYFYPEFTGTLLSGLTAYVSDTAPAMEIDYPWYLIPTLDNYFLPTSNQLQVWVANSTHLELTNSTDGFEGWFSDKTVGEILASLMVYESGSVLIAANSFSVSAIGAFISNGPRGYPGGNITIWGNTFYNDPEFCGFCNAEAVHADCNGSCIQYFDSPIAAEFQALELVASGDLVYNNNVSTQSTAETPAFEYDSFGPYLVPFTYHDSWNVSHQPASAVRTDPDFPGFPLTGSILGTTYQGGNFWSNYGAFPNSYATLPYANYAANATGYAPGITVGGDYVPLLAAALYTVEVFVQDLANGTPWQVQLYATEFHTLYDVDGTSDGNFTALLPNGTYTASGSLPSYAAPPVLFGVSGPGTEVRITFPSFYPVTFVATGPGSTSTAWSVTATGPGESTSGTNASGDRIVLDLANGSFDYQAATSLPNPGNISVAEPSGNVTVNGSATSVSIEFAVAYLTTFLPVGLPGAFSWYIDFGVSNGTVLATGASNITRWFANGSYQVEYSSLAPNYLPYELAGTGYGVLAFEVNGSGPGVLAVFSKATTVTFTQSGLPTGGGQTWTVDVSGVGNKSAHAGGELRFQLPNGTYDVTATSSDPSYAWTGTPATFTANGTALNVVMTFQPNGSFVVTFAGIGLASGTGWIVLFNGSVAYGTGPTIAIAIAGPGTFPFAVTSLNGSLAPSPASGTVAATDRNTTVDIAFAPVVRSEPVFFTASGVWTGTSWGVEVASTNLSSSTATIAFYLAPGIYNYTVFGPTGYTASPSNGSLRVEGVGLSIGITFSPVSYTVSFVEAGLPLGADWAVQLGAVLLGSTTAWINFTAVPGSYLFLVGYLPGWSATPAAGSVSVTTTNLSESISFSDPPPADGGPVPMALLGSVPILAART